MTADREPQTEAGQALVEQHGHAAVACGLGDAALTAAILAIEAEARAEERERVQLDPRAEALRPARRGGPRQLTFDNGRYERYESISVQHPGGEWDRILIARDDGTIAALLVDLINAAPAPPPAGIDVERLREAVWNANRENGWAEAVDRTTHMANQIATEYARLTSQPLEGAKLADARIEQLQDLVRRLTECLHPAMTTGGRPCACQTHADARAGLQVDNPHG